MGIPILGYHKVGSEAEFGRRLNIEPCRLEDHVRFFARRGYRFVTGRALAGDWPARTVVFTFDDGFAGAVHEGSSVLERHKAVGTFYVVTRLVGEVSSWPGESAFPLADWAALRAAAARGHEIGNHTQTHARLEELPPEVQLAEIAGASEDLEREGLGGGSFCLPYGSYSSETKDLLVSAGVSVVMSTRKGVAQPGDDRLLLPRVFVAFGDSLPLLMYRIWVLPVLRKKKRA